MFLTRKWFDKSRALPDTAGTCEPLVYGLQHSKRALVAGENTSGAMLNGEIFSFSPRLILWIPTAEYYTAVGKRLHRKGVALDIAVKSEEALECVLKRIESDRKK